MYSGFLNHNIIVLTCFKHRWNHVLSTKQRQQKQMGGGRKPQGKSLMSQFHCDNGARALGIVAIVHSHSVHQLTRKLQHILARSYWSWLTRPRSILTDKEVSLASFCCERGPQWPWQLPVATFKQEQESDACLSTNHNMTFCGVLLRWPIKYMSIFF